MLWISLEHKLEVVPLSLFVGNLFVRNVFVWHLLVNVFIGPNLILLVEGRRWYCWGGFGFEGCCYWFWLFGCTTHETTIIGLFCRLEAFDDFLTGGEATWMYYGTCACFMYSFATFWSTTPIICCCTCNIWWSCRCCCVAYIYGCIVGCGGWMYILLMVVGPLKCRFTILVCPLFECWG